MGIDFSTDHGKRVLGQLETEEVIWLTTVAKSGTPQPNPVWFQYVDDAIYVYTQETAKRLKNWVENDRVSLNFNTDAEGESVSVLTGRISVDDSFPKLIDNPAYIDKYREAIKRINTTPEQMSVEYPVVMKIKPEKLRGW